METRKKERMQCFTLQKVNFDTTLHSPPPPKKKQFSNLLVKDISAFIAKHFQVVYRRQKALDYFYFTTSEVNWLFNQTQLPKIVFKDISFQSEINTRSWEILETEFS